MANPNWVKGGQSPNGHGRPKKKSSPTIQRMIENFVKRNVSPRKLQALYDRLEAKDRLIFLTDLLPYAISKKPTQAAVSINTLPDSQLNELFDQVMNGAGLLPDVPIFEDVTLIQEPQTLTNGQG